MAKARGVVSLVENKDHPKGWFFYWFIKFIGIANANIPKFRILSNPGLEGVYLNSPIFRVVS